MRFSCAVALCIFPSLLQSQDVLFDLAGDWTGVGNYLDRNIEEDIRCRLNIATDAAMSDLTGVCASARQREDVQFRILRQDDGRVLSEQTNPSIDGRDLQLTGTLEPDGVSLSGQQFGEKTDLTMRLVDETQMELRIVVTAESRTQTTSILFDRR